MDFPLEPTMTWQDHFATYGFAVLRGVMDRGWVNAAMAEVQRIVGQDLPPEQWTTGNVGARHIREEAQRSPILRAVYDDPNLRRLIDEMLGAGQWNGEREFQLFISPYNPDAAPHLPERGHLDFVECPIPIFGSGVMFQVALHRTEPMGGNIAIWPGSHRTVQRLLMENPDRQFPKDFDDRGGPCYQFVAEPGDVLFFSHLVYHEATVNHCPGRSPRVNLHGQANRARWLSRIDPSDPNLSVWERSLAQNGPYTATRDEERWCLDFRRQRRRTA